MSFALPHTAQANVQHKKGRPRGPAQKALQIPFQPQFVLSGLSSSLEEGRKHGRWGLVCWEQQRRAGGRFLLLCEQLVHGLLCCRDLGQQGFKFMDYLWVNGKLGSFLCWSDSLDGLRNGSRRSDSGGGGLFLEAEHGRFCC